MATVILAPEPQTRWAIARSVEARFGGDNGILRTRAQGAYDEVPKLERAGLIRVVGNVPTRRGSKTDLFGATQAGVTEWRGWLESPITTPDAVTGTLTRLYAARPTDYTTMLQIIDRFEATLQRLVQQAVDPGEPEGVVDRGALAWNERVFVAQLQWCQDFRDIIDDDLRGERP